SPLDG
ncbi:hypothetical protein JL09_g6398, partial [Pichia kudriavzevii]